MKAVRPRAPRRSKAKAFGGTPHTAGKGRGDPHPWPAHICPKLTPIVPPTPNADLIRTASSYPSRPNLLDRGLFLIRQDLTAAANRKPAQAFAGRLLGELLPSVICRPGGHRTGRLLFGAGRPEPTSDFDAVAVKDEKPIGRRIRIFEPHFDKPLLARRNEFI